MLPRGNLDFSYSQISGNVFEINKPNVHLGEFLQQRFSYISPIRGEISAKSQHQDSFSILSEISAISPRSRVISAISLQKFCTSCYKR